MKSYCDKSTAKRGFIRMGGDAAQFESVVKEVDGKWQVDDSALPKKAKRVSTRWRPPHFPSCNLPHKTGNALVQHIVLFNKSRHFVPGGSYIIGGKEVTI